MNPLPLSAKAREKPNATHNTVTMPIARNDIMIMFSTLFERTMPP